MSTERLGSLNDFVQETGLAPKDALSEYTVALSALRCQMAQDRGITLAELHAPSPLKVTETAEA